LLLLLLSVLLLLSCLALFVVFPTLLLESWRGTLGSERASSRAVKVADKCYCLPCKLQ
jgi:hypothetical protein